MSPWRRRVLVVEDEPLMAALLAESLTAAGFETQTAAEAADARLLAEAFDPDLAIIDIVLGDGPTGLHLAHAFRETQPGMAMLVLTEHADPVRASGGIPMPDGVGLIHKGAIGDIVALHAAVETALSGESTPQVSAQGTSDSDLPLDARQLRVLELLAKGYDNVAIGRHLEMSTKTAERVVQQIYDALDIVTRSDLNPRVEAARQFILRQGLPERLP